MKTANLGRQHHKSLNSYFQELLRLFVFVLSYELLFHVIYIAQTHCAYFKFHIAYDVVFP